MIHSLPFLTALLILALGGYRNADGKERFPHVYQETRTWFQKNIPLFPSIEWALGIGCPVHVRYEIEQKVSVAPATINKDWVLEMLYS